MDIDNILKEVSRIVLKKELRPTLQYYDFLNRYIDQIKQSNSVISGKKVFYQDPYPKNTDFVSLDEINKVRIEPLKPYEYRDIDGLIEAIKERFYYSGNKIFGNSIDIEESENCGDSSNVYRSHQIFGSQNILYSQMIAGSRYLIGCGWTTKTNFSINTLGGYGSSRCFESIFINNTTDSYYSYNLKNCLEMIFCFNQYSKRYCIGNNELSKDKYFELKEKLLLEITTELEARKTIKSLFEIVNGGFTNE